MRVHQKLRIFKIIALALLFINFFFVELIRSIGADSLKIDLKPDESQKRGSIIIYPWEAITRRKILPHTHIMPAATGTEIMVQACRGEYEPASFIIRALRDFSNIKISVSDLSDTNGNIISKDYVDIRIVKCWYQAGTSVAKGKKVLVPELLLKDDSLVKVDEKGKINYLKVKINNVMQYIDITSSNAIFPSNAELNDAKILMPFNISKNTNKQIWLTIHVPDNAVPGLYIGSISLNDGLKWLGELRLNLTVLPFSLEKPEIEYGLYYTARLQQCPARPLSALNKSESQYKIELKNMKDHGVLYPTLYQGYDELLEQALKLRKMAGLPNDKLFTHGLNTENIVPITPAKLIRLQNAVEKWKKIISKFGYNKLYIYGKDEAKGETLRAQRVAWQTAHNMKVEVFVACYKNAVDEIGDLLDIPVLSGAFKPKEVEKWHQLGKKVYIYGNPQAGNEDPYIYRRNYGIKALCMGYDGVMNFAYQFGFGHLWNDFDNPGKGKTDNYRDHVFAYPTSNGIIDTIQWEGFREAVDDVRYITTLAKKTNTTNYQLLCKSVSKYHDLKTIRKVIIEWILF